MSEKETIDKVKDKQGIFSKIQNFFTLGYGTKEDIRELDKKLRDLYYVDLRDMRHTWEDLYLAAIDAGQAQSRDYKKVIQVLDRVMEKVRHADYGYAGLFDRKGHIREDELARSYNFDKEFSADLDALQAAVDKTQKGIDMENWEVISADVKTVKTLLLSFEDKWTEREKQFRPIDV